MKVRFDQKSDALYFRLDDSKIVESEEVKPGITLDFNEKNQVVSVEIDFPVLPGLAWVGWRN